MSGIIFKNAKLYDGEKLHGELRDVVVEDGKISHIGNIKEANDDTQVFELDGRLLCPGFWDIHTHLRDPGQEWREDMDTGAAAGAAGGYVTLVAMPNTDPAADTPAAVAYVAMKGERTSGARVLPAGAVTKNRAGEEITEMLSMAEKGAVLFTDDGAPVRSAAVLRMTMRYLKSGRLNAPIMEHCEDKSLFGKGQVHEGRISTLSGMHGIPASCETIDVARCIEIVREIGYPLHLTHLSSARSIEMVRAAKAEGLPVTCDVTPHHLVFTEDDVIASGYDALFKVNPPLRSQADRDALWAGLTDGTVDAIATDHAPWHEDEKDLPFQEAAFGIASLECAASGVIDAAARRGVDVEVVLNALSGGPQAVLGFRTDGPLIKPGAAADLTCIDMDIMQKVDASSWKSKVRHTPWQGMVLRGWPVLTVRDGRVIHCSMDTEE